MITAVQDQAALTDVLSEMPALFLPDPVSWWPPAPGWWILSTLIITLITWTALRFVHHYRGRATIRHALRELDKLDASIEQQNQAQHLDSLIKASAVLRQVTNDFLEQPYHSTESGEQWLKSMDSMVNNAPSRKSQTILDSPEGKIFEKIYSNQTISSNELSTALMVSKNWIKAAARSRPGKPTRQARPKSQASSIMLDKKGEY